MIYVDVFNMRFFDQAVLNHLRNNAQNGQIRIVYGELADRFYCHRKTAQNTIHKLRSAGHLEIISGSDKTGYVYRINCD